jgi:hypothetical protein
MEIQAMKSGIKPRDNAEIDAIYARRLAAAGAAYPALEQMARDFEGLKDVAALAAQAAALARDKRVRDGLKKEREEEAREQHSLDEILSAEEQLRVQETHAEALQRLRDQWKSLAAAAAGPEDTAARRIARRVMRGLAMGAADRVRDPDYLRVLESYRLPRQR